MRALAAALSAGALAAAMLGSQQRAGAEPAASKIVDRTVSCAVGLTGGIHEVEVTANTGTRMLGKRSVWKYLAGAGVEDFGTRAQGDVSAGNPLPPPAPGFPAGSERLSFSAPPLCRSAPRIVLTKTGLAPAAVSGIPPNPGEGIDCYPGKRVLIRVRGIFSAPTSLHVKRYQNQPGLLAASGTIVVGYLAIHSVSGKPLAYAEVFQNGKAQLFTARSCSG